MSGMYEVWLECVVCGSTFEVGAMMRGCPKCSPEKSAVEVRYEYAKARAERLDSKPGLWQWSRLLPPFSQVESLGEGNTPLVPYPIAGSNVRLFIKNETQNPTWSWKDRANTVSVSAARHFGYRKFSVISTGNHGSAAAAYSATAGLQCRVLCDPNISPIHLQLMRHYGAETVVGGSQELAMCQMLGQGDWFPGVVICPRDGYANPYGVEGFKTIAFEIVEQLDGKAPDRVFVPTGSGDGLYGIAKGFRELVLTGAIEQSPKIVGCQTVAVNPFVQAFRQRAQHVARVPAKATIARSIAEPIGDQVALQAIYESDGEAVDTSENRIREAVKLLAHRGLALEPSSAVALACALEHPDLACEETWIVIGTGTAIRWPESFPEEHAI